VTREKAIQILKNVVAPVPESETPNAEGFVCCVELYGCSYSGFEVYEAIETIAKESTDAKNRATKDG